MEENHEKLRYIILLWVVQMYLTILFDMVHSLTVHITVLNNLCLILFRYTHVLLYRGMSRNEAVLKFLLRVKWLDGYGLRLYAAKVWYAHTYVHVMSETIIVFMMSVVSVVVQYMTELT